MNRPNHFMKQLVAQAAWLRAQGDDAGAAIADELADHIHDRHEGVDDQTAPEWANGPDVEVDNEPDIRCSPAVGVVFPNNEGEMILTIDMCDGGDVAVVHMGDVVRWIERRGAPADNESAHDAERKAYDATVGSGYEGEAIDAEFEITPEEWVTLKPGEPTVGDLADPVLLGMVDGVDDAELDGEAEQAELDRAEWEPLHDDAQEDS